MFEVKVPERIKKYCSDLVAHVNFGLRGFFDGTKKNQWVGMVGQNMILDLFGLPLVVGTTGFDNGVDLEYAGLKIDVKTMGKTKPQVKNTYLVYPVESQKKYPTDIYLFVAFNTTNDVLTVCGWSDKEHFFKTALYSPVGTVEHRGDGTTFLSKAGMYKIHQSNLSSPGSVEDLQAEWQYYGFWREM